MRDIFPPVGGIFPTWRRRLKRLFLKSVWLQPTPPLMVHGIDNLADKCVRGSQRAAAAETSGEVTNIPLFVWNYQPRYWWETDQDVILSTEDPDDWQKKGTQFKDSCRIKYKHIVGQRKAAGVEWVKRERLDFSITYWVPAAWIVNEIVGENFINVQCAPRVLRPLSWIPNELAEDEPVTQLSSYGFNITAFAYNQRINSGGRNNNVGTNIKKKGLSTQYSELNHYLLLQNFAKRFLNTVDPAGGIIVNCSKPAGDPIIEHQRENFSTELATQLENCSVCELQFTPSGAKSAVRGFCRAFYHPNSRFHYVAMIATQSEYEKPIVTIALCGVEVLLTIRKESRFGSKSSNN